jgi:hypothetical protein
VFPCRSRSVAACLCLSRSCSLSSVGLGFFSLPRSVFSSINRVRGDVRMPCHCLAFARRSDFIVVLASMLDHPHVHVRHVLHLICCPITTTDFSPHHGGPRQRLLRTAIIIPSSHLFFCDHHLLKAAAARRRTSTVGSQRARRILTGWRIVGLFCFVFLSENKSAKALIDVDWVMGR